MRAPGKDRTDTDPYAREPYPPTTLTIVESIRSIAARRAIPSAKVALAWLLNRPGVTAPSHLNYITAAALTLLGST